MKYNEAKYGVFNAKEILKGKIPPSLLIGKHAPLLPNKEIDRELHYALIKSGVEHLSKGGSRKDTPNMFQVVKDLALHSADISATAGKTNWGISLRHALVIMQAFGMQIKSKNELFYQNWGNGKYDVHRELKPDYNGVGQYRSYPILTDLYMHPDDYTTAEALNDFAWDGEVNQYKAQFWINYLQSDQETFQYVGLDPSIANIKVEFAEDSSFEIKPIESEDDFYGAWIMPNFAYLCLNYSPELEAAFRDNINSYVSDADQQTGRLDEWGITTSYLRHLNGDVKLAKFFELERIFFERLKLFQHDNHLEIK